MYTLTLKIGSYSREHLEKKLPLFIKEQGLGQVSKIVCVSEESGYFAFVVDIFCPDISLTVNMLEMLCSASSPIPENLHSIDFYHAAYTITRFPEGMGLQDVVALMNSMMISNAVNRMELHSVHSRIEKLEETLNLSQKVDLSDVEPIVNVVNKIATQVFGHEMLMSSQDKQLEVKPRWLH